MNEQKFYTQVTSVATYLAKAKKWLDSLKLQAKESDNDDERKRIGVIIRNCTQHYAKVVALEKGYLLCELATGFGKFYCIFV